MSNFTAPVSMLAAKGSGGTLAASVIGLLIVLAVMARRDPTTASSAR